MEAIHLCGPTPAVRRLARLAEDLGLAHDLESGVLRLAVSDGCRLITEASVVLAPLEARLVRAVMVDVEEVTGVGLLALAATAPSVANLIVRQCNGHLLRAIETRDGVAVRFQPVIHIASSRVVGFEALLRVRVGGHDVPPAEVLAVAEDAGRLAEIDAVARSVAVTEAAASIGDRLLFLNVLPASLPVPAEMLAPLAHEVRTLGLDPGRVVLEMPVGPAGSLRRQVEAVFRATRDVGFLVGLDNVRSERDLDAVHVRADVVKLDRSLVRGLPSPSATIALGGVIRSCGHEDAMLVAQGIESPEQLRAVRDLGVQLAQGWHLGRPGPITA